MAFVRWRRERGAGLAWVIALACATACVAGSIAGTPRAKSLQPAVRAIGRMPVRFEPNVGQFDEGVRFVARAKKTNLFLTDEGATIDNGDGTPLRLKVRGGRELKPAASRPLVTKSNYFLGNDPAKWRTDVATFARVTYPNVIDGVDLVFHGEDGQIEYDFVAAPGVDVSRIAMEVDGAEGLSLTNTGELAVKTTTGTMVHGRPRVFQHGDDGRERDIAARYRIVDDHAIAFEVAAHDPSRAIVIDPILVSSTYLGGMGGESAGGIAVNDDGNIFVAGSTSSANFPIKNAYQPLYANGGDAFVAKLDPGEGSLVYATYIGGTQSDEAHAIKVDASGAAYVGGQTASPNFPTQNPLAPNQGNGFVLKLTPQGNGLVYATRFGATVGAIAINASGEVVMTGTCSAGLPTVNAFQPNFGSTTGEPDAFVSKLNAAGNALVYSTFLGGSRFERAQAVAVDAADNAYVTGYTTSADFPIANAFQATGGGIQPNNNLANVDGFVTKLTATGGLAYSTYLGGSNQDHAFGIAVDGAGSVYVTGDTWSQDFPTKNPIQGPPPATGIGVFLTKIDPAGTSLMYSTHLHGAFAMSAEANGVVVDPLGNATFVVTTDEPDFPTVNPVQPYKGAGFKVVVGRMNAAGTGLDYSTYLGGSGIDKAKRESSHTTPIAIDKRRAVYVFARTQSGDVPTRTDKGASPIQVGLAGGSDTFIAKISTIVASPVEATLPTGGYRAISAAADYPPLTYAFVTNASGGTLNAQTGDYFAGPNANTTDIIEVTDAEGASSLARINVVDPNAPPDAGVDAAADASSDASMDAAADASSPDASIDGGPPALDASTPPASSSASSSSSGGSGTPSPDAGSPPSSNEGGCSVVNASGAGDITPLLGLAGALLLLRRRRKGHEWRRRGGGSSSATIR